MLLGSPNRVRFERAGRNYGAFTESNENRFIFKKHVMGGS